MISTARAISAAMVACLLASSALAAAPACVSGADEAALQARMVQTELMVAALSCHEAVRYNVFMKANQPMLMVAHTRLGRFFKTRGGEKALNSFITRLANESSRRSVGDIARFCQESGWLYDAALSPSRGDFAAFTRRLLVAQRHGFTPCAPPASYVALGPSGPVEVAVAAAPVAPAVALSSVPTPRPKPARLASL